MTHKFKIQNLKFQIDEGFTLIELLVVMAIIAILSTAGIIAYTGLQERARDTKRRADIDAIADAFETHYNNSLNDKCGNGTGGLGSGVNANGGTYCPPQPDWFSGNLIPKDPSTGADYIYQTGVAAITGSVPESGAVPTAAVSFFRVCTLLEGNKGNTVGSSGAGGSGSSATHYCRTNRQ